jgi:hypothetical protein
LSLENYNEETRRATKAAIFRERTIQKKRPTAVVNSPEEALLVTLNERGCVDLDYLGGLLHRRPTEFLPDLRGTIFLNPQTNRWETEDACLSGNVREKLETAEAALLLDDQFKINVEALKAVQPTDLSAVEIDARLGSTWIPPEDIQQFAEELLGEASINVSHAAQLGLWVVRGGYGARFSVANTTEWGTEQRSALDLIEDALNLAHPLAVIAADDAQEPVGLGAERGKARDPLAADVHLARIAGVVNLDARFHQLVDQADNLQPEERENAGPPGAIDEVAVNVVIVVVTDPQHPNPLGGGKLDRLRHGLKRREIRRQVNVAVHLQPPQRLTSGGCLGGEFRGCPQSLKKCEGFRGTLRHNDKPTANPTSFRFFRGRHGLSIANRTFEKSGLPNGQAFS